MTMADDTLALFGNDLFGDPIRPPSSGPLADEFIVPPFSVLNARDGIWQDRKRAWLRCGIKGEVGRSSPSIHCPNDSWTRGDGGSDDYISVFDPVLTELAYRWFCPPGGEILDPFAGGSVRGIVASLLGFRYVGIDLSSRQIEANNEQAGEICPDNAPLWLVGDSLARLADVPDASRDFVFSCPPYADLERYSDDPRDLSTMNYGDFLDAYNGIVGHAVAKLRPDRFACFVVGDIRSKSGEYRGLVGDTVAAFRSAGCDLYNDAILINAVGSLPMRVRRQFNASRKLGKAHQNVLVFVKGDWRKAAGACR